MAAGCAIIATGILIAPLPGPGFTILGPAGLALMASEFRWARILMRRLSARFAAMQRGTDKIAERTSFWWVPVVAIAYWVAVWFIAEKSPIPSFVVWAVSFPVFMPVILWGWATLRYRGVGGMNHARPAHRHRIDG